MYAQVRENERSIAVTPALRVTAWRIVSRTVVALGFTSMFTDISSEMVSAVLPLYFLMYLHLSPIQLGVLDGLYQGGSALMGLASGFVADRWRRHKLIALTGYALSAVCRPLFLAAGSAAGLLGLVVLVDRTGKGIRTAPRDALISFTSRSEALGTSFGFHRMLDTAGAIVGPLVAFGLLAIAPGQFDVIFVVSLCVALLGLAVLILFVDDVVAPRTTDGRAARVSLSAALRLLRRPRFSALVIAGTLLSLATISDAFVYLILQRSLSLNVGVFPLLYVATSTVYFVLALPVGRLADRAGREPVFVCGYLLLAGCIGVLLAAPVVGNAWWIGLLALVLLGAYYACTDGVLMALGSAAVPARLRTTGLGVLSTSTSGARLIASVLFGAVWTWAGAEPALVLFGVGVVEAAGFAGLALWKTRKAADSGNARSQARAWFHHPGCTGCAVAAECGRWDAERQP
jgi:MFS family permease